MEDLNKILEGLREGKSNREITNTVSISYSRVCKIIKKLIEDRKNN